MNDPELEKEITRIKGEIDYIHNITFSNSLNTQKCLAEKMKECEDLKKDNNILNTKLDYWKNRCEDSSKRIKQLHKALQTVREDRNNLIIQAARGQCPMINDLRYKLRVGKQTQQDLQSEITQLTKRNEIQAESIQGYQQDRLSHYSKLQSEITQLTKRNKNQEGTIKCYQQDRLSHYSKLQSEITRLTEINKIQAETIKNYQQYRLSHDGRDYGKLIPMNSKLTMINAKQGQQINELLKVIAKTGNNLGYIQEDINQCLNTPKG